MRFSLNNARVALESILSLLIYNCTKPDNFMQKSDSQNLHNQPSTQAILSLYLRLLRSPIVRVLHLAPKTGTSLYTFLLSVKPLFDISPTRAVATSPQQEMRALLHFQGCLIYIDPRTHSRRQSQLFKIHALSCGRLCLFKID